MLFSVFALVIQTPEPSPVELVAAISGAGATITFARTVVRYLRSRKR